MTRALRSGALTDPNARRGSVTFDRWLEGSTTGDSRVVAADAVGQPAEPPLP